MKSLDYQYIGQLVSRAQKGDNEAFAELYAATYQRQYQFFPPLFKRRISGTRCLTGDLHACSEKSEQSQRSDTFSLLAESDQFSCLLQSPPKADTLQSGNGCSRDCLQQYRIRQKHPVFPFSGRHRHTGRYKAVPYETDFEPAIYRISSYLIKILS